MAGGNDGGAASGRHVPGTRCACGRVAVPPEPYGCEVCGALTDTLAPIEVELAGVVRGAATVHRHHRPEPKTPFTVVEIALDAGPVLKGVLDPESPAPTIGGRILGDVLEGMLTLVVPG